MKRKLLALLLVLTTSVMIFAGCGSGGTKGDLTSDEALEEIDSMMKRVSVETIENPTLDMNSGETTEADALSDISTFPLTVTGNGEVNIEIAAATELSSDAPDNWINETAEKFNQSHQTVNGKSVSVSVRKIASGEVVTYMRANAYQPNVFIPSNDAWGKMLQVSGIQTTQITDRLVGNTAGILMKKDVYEDFIKKYKEVNVKTVMEATLAGDLTFAYTNPYTSSTGLNILTAMLAAFDPEDPLSEKAQEKLLEYQATSPPVAYTTSVLRNQAAKGIVNAMVMEEQAYSNTPELANFKYIPAGIRHDHPVYTFSYDSEDEIAAAQMFTEFCKSDENQKLAESKGFNKHNDYASQDPGLDGAGYLSAQTIWKNNKTGGQPIISVFIADVSGSMDGTPLNEMKKSLTNCSGFINASNYVGLVSYSTDVTIHLPVAPFDAKQRAYFTGEVNNLSASGATATYDAVLVGLQMIKEQMKSIPNAKPMLFVLSDGEQNEGYDLDRITPLIKGLSIPVYTISYNYQDTNNELAELSGINEAAALQADSENIMNELRNLFNVTV